MQKSVFDSIVAKFEELGITEYNVRIEGGNKNLFHNGKTDLIFSTEDAIIGIKATQSYSTNGNYDMAWCHWDDVNCVKLTSVSIQDMLKLKDAFGLDADKIKAMIQDNTIVRKNIVPGTANLDAIRNDDGNVTVMNTPVYVTNGHVAENTKLVEVSESTVEDYKPEAVATPTEAEVENTEPDGVSESTVEDVDTPTDVEV